MLDYKLHKGKIYINTDEYIVSTHFISSVDLADDYPKNKINESIYLLIGITVLITKVSEEEGNSFGYQRISFYT